MVGCEDGEFSLLHPIVPSMFSVHGLLETIVTDNGTVFTSSEFQDFVKVSGIRSHLNSTILSSGFQQPSRESCEDS